MLPFLLLIDETKTVNVHTHRQGVTLCVWFLCIFFVLAGYAFLPRFGIEADETLFVQGLYQPRAELYSLQVGRSHLPVMLMSYVGALKSWIYMPVFKVFGTGLKTLRVPVLLVGAASLWCFFLLLRRIAGERTALIGCGLLAVDSMYLLTVCFDWGPVALQHLLLLGGMVLLVQFYQERKELALAAGCFLLGLALWDKALAVWTLSGMAIGAFLTFPRQIFALITRRNLAVAALGFLVGALPLIIYNGGNHWMTFTGNFRRDTTPNAISGKAMMLVDTARGNGLFGWLTAEDWQTPVQHAPRGIVQTASAKISALAGHPRRQLFFHAFLLALLVAPFAGRNALRGILFALITMAVAWIQMAIAANTGGSVHHTILLWPFPVMVVALAFGGASRRLGRAGIPAVAALSAVVMISGFLVLNEYYAMAVRDGGAQAWNNGIYNLSAYLKTVPAKGVYCMDWGIMDPLRLLHRGKLPLLVGSDPISKPELTTDDRRIVRDMISDPEHIFIGHTKDFEFFPGSTPKLVQFAADAGLQRDTMAVISDPFGRPVFEVFRFR